jgi:hypothetical protein
MNLRRHLFGAAPQRIRAGATGHRHSIIEDVNAGCHNVG